jgi:hypothetical protein
MTMAAMHGRRKASGWPRPIGPRHDGGGDCGVAQEHSTLPSLRAQRSNPAKRNHAHHPNECQLEAPQYWQRCPGWPQRCAPRHDAG